MVLKVTQNRPRDRKFLKALVVQANIPQEQKWDSRYQKDILEIYQHLSRTNEDIDMIIWPETSVPGLYEGDKKIFTKVNDLVKSQNKYLLFGAIRDDGVDFYNSAYLLNQNAEILNIY